MAEKTVYEILTKHFPPGQYAVMAEVSDAAGFSRSRSADYVVMGLWPSRGLDLACIELKSYRSDWLSELKKPQKAENHYKYCDQFWLLTNENMNKNAGPVAKLEEIPPNWGWMEIKNGKIKINKPAPKLTPEPISRHYLAALLKRASSKDGYILKSEIAAHVEEQKEAAQRYNMQEIKELKEEQSRFHETIKYFAKETGMDLYMWRNYSDTSQKQFHELVPHLKMLLQGGPDQITKDLIDLKERAERILKKINSGLEPILNKPITEAAQQENAGN